MTVKSKGDWVMAKEEAIRINAQDVSGQKAAVVEGVTPDITVQEVMQKVMAEMELPANDPSGRPLTYHARLEREGTHLNADDKVGEAGLQNDDMITLQPNVDAGR